MNGQYLQSSIKEQYTPRWDQMSFQTNTSQFKFPTTEFSQNYQLNPTLLHHPSHHNGYSPIPMQISSALKKSIDPMSPRGESKNFLDENSLDATFLNFINNTREDCNKQDILNSNRKTNGGIPNGININNFLTNNPSRPTLPSYQAATVSTTATVAPSLLLSPQIPENILTTNRFNQSEQANKIPQIVSVQSPSSNSASTSWAYSQIMQKYSTQPAPATSAVPSGGIQVNEYKPMLIGNENKEKGIPITNYGLGFKTQTPVDVRDYSTNVVNKVTVPQTEQIKYISNQPNNSSQPALQGFRDAVLLASSAMKFDNQRNYQSANTGAIKTEPDISNYESVMKKYMPQSPERIVSHQNLPDDLSSRKSSVSARVIGIQKSGNRDGSRESRPIATSKELLKNFSSVLFSPPSQVMSSSQLQGNSNYSSVKSQQQFQQQQQTQQPQRILGQGNLREFPSTSSETTANPFQQTNRDFTLADNNNSFQNIEQQKYSQKSQQQQQFQQQQEQKQQQPWQKQINPIQENGSQYRPSNSDRFGQIPLYITSNSAALNLSEKKYQQGQGNLLNVQQINKGAIYNGGGSSSLETPPHSKAMSINPIEQESILSRYSSQRSVKTEQNLQGGRSDSQTRPEEGKRQVQVNGIEAEQIQTPTSRASYSSQYASNNRVPLSSIVPTVAFQLKPEKSKFIDYSNSHNRLNSDSSGRNQQIPTVQSIDQVGSNDQSMFSENNQSGLFRVKMNHGESMTSNAPSHSNLESQHLINPSPVEATNAIKDLIRTIKTEELNKFPRQINVNYNSNFGNNSNNIKEGNQFLKPQTGAVPATGVQNGQPINQNTLRPIPDQFPPMNVMKGVQVFCIHCNRFYQQNDRDGHQCQQKEATLKMLLDEEWKVDQQLVEILGRLQHLNQSSVHYKNELTSAIYAILERNISIPVLQRETRRVIMINQTMAGYQTQESKPALALGLQVESLVKRKVDIRMKRDSSSNQIVAANNNNNNYNNTNMNSVDIYNLSNQQSPSMKSNNPLSQRDFQSPLQTQTSNRLSTAFSPRSPEGGFSKTMNSFQTNQSAFNLRNGSDTESRGNFSEKNFYSGDNNNNNNRLNNFARDRNLQTGSRDVLLGNGDGRSLSNNSQAFTEKGERSTFGALQGGERQQQYVGVPLNLNNQFDSNQQRINPSNVMIKPKFQQIFQRTSISPSQGLRIVPSSQQPFKQVQFQQQQNQIVQPKAAPQISNDSANISSQRTQFYSLALTSKLRLPIGHPGNQVDLLNMFNAAVSQNVPQPKYLEFITSYFQNMK